MSYGIRASMELNLDIVTAEVRETAKALIEFAEKLEEIDRKYQEMYRDKYKNKSEEEK